MNPPAEDLIDYLEANTSLVMGSTLFAVKLPEKSGTMACLLDTGGMGPDPHEIQNPTVQVLARANIGEYQAAYSLMDSILTELHALSNIDINGTSYIFVLKNTEILSLGEDKKGRSILSCNLRIKRS